MAKTLKRSQHKRKQTQHKRKQSKRTHRRRQRGGNTGFLSALQKAVIPFLFYKAQKTQQRRVVKQRKLKRSNKTKRR